jgi:hypothetical protein
MDYIEGVNNYDWTAGCYTLGFKEFNTLCLIVLMFLMHSYHVRKKEMVSAPLLGTGTPPILTQLSESDVSQAGSQSEEVLPFDKDSQADSQSEEVLPFDKEDKDTYM